MIKYRKFSFGVFIFLILGVFTYLCVPRIVEIPDWASEMFNLKKKAAFLMEYAQNHGGKFPEFNTSELTNGFGVKAVYVVIYSKNDGCPYAFLYFPNKSIDYSEAREERRILAASLKTSYSWDRKAIVRSVMYTNGGVEPLKENDFQALLNSGNQ